MMPNVVLCQQQSGGVDQPHQMTPGMGPANLGEIGMSQAAGAPPPPYVQQWAPAKAAKSLQFQRLERALDLTPVIDYVDNLLAQPIDLYPPTSGATASSSRAGVPPVNPAVAKIWTNTSDRKRDLSELYNLKNAKKRHWLKTILLEDSDSDSEMDRATVSNEDLKILLKIHKRRRKFQKEYHNDVMNSQYTYYSAGLLSSEDRFPAHQQYIQELYRVNVEEHAVDGGSEIDGQVGCSSATRPPSAIDEKGVGSNPGPGRSSRLVGGSNGRSHGARRPARRRAPPSSTAAGKLGTGDGAKTTPQSTGESQTSCHNNDAIVVSSSNQSGSFMKEVKYANDSPAAGLASVKSESCKVEMPASSGDDSYSVVTRDGAVECNKFVTSLVSHPDSLDHSSASASTTRFDNILRSEDQSIKVEDTSNSDSYGRTGDRDVPSATRQPANKRPNPALHFDNHDSLPPQSASPLLSVASSLALNRQQQLALGGSGAGELSPLAPATVGSQQLGGDDGRIGWDQSGTRGAMDNESGVSLRFRQVDGDTTHENPGPKVDSRSTGRFDLCVSGSNVVDGNFTGFKTVEYQMNRGMDFDNNLPESAINSADFSKKANSEHLMDARSLYKPDGSASAGGNLSLVSPQNQGSGGQVRGIRAGKIQTPEGTVPISYSSSGQPNIVSPRNSFNTQTNFKQEDDTVSGPEQLFSPIAFLNTTLRMPMTAIEDADSSPDTSTLRN